MPLEQFLNYSGKLNAILVEIRIKKENGVGYFKKVKATALDFPIINFALSKIDGKYKIVVGARPMIASVAHNACNYLNSLSKIEEDDYLKTGELVANELKCLDNRFASKEYREDLIKVYVKRGLKEVSK